jgi:hypothetical protein
MLNPRRISTFSFLKSAVIKSFLFVSFACGHILTETYPSGHQVAYNYDPGKLMQMPGRGTIGFRTFMTKSPKTAATIDVQSVRGITVTIKFNPKH